MAELVLITKNPDKAAVVLKEAIEQEKSRIKYSLRVTRNRLKKFEKKYKVPSEHFIKEWSSENLKGGDLEYVEWAGEYRISLNLNDRLNTLKSIKHASSSLFI